MIAQTEKALTTWLRVLCITLLVLGVFFRFVNLDKKVYWHDEVYTTFLISGHTRDEFEQVFQGREIGVEELQKYQQPKPDNSFSNTIQSLVKIEPQHPPLYYLLTQLWVGWFGSSVAATRSIGALLSLLTFPCVYGLCLELFSSSIVGWVAVALFSVSPFHILYAQEAREYSLWTVTILLSSWALLRAMRLNTKPSWIIYAGTLVLSLYTFLLSLLVMFGHGMYVLMAERFRPSKVVIAYLLASLAGLLAFSPWLLNISEINAASWTSRRMSFFALFGIWAANLSRLFFDVNLDSKDQLLYTIPPLLLLLPLIGYSLYFLVSKTPKSVWLFILTLAGAAALPMILPDLILGGRRSSVSRYLIPCYLGVQLSVAYLLATKMASLKSSHQKLWRGVMALLVTAGVVSCIVSANADTWWTKKNSHHHPEVARIINQSSQPLLISSNFNVNRGELLSLSHLLEDKVRLQLVLEPKIPQVAEGFSDIYLFNPSKELRRGLEREQNYKVKQIQPEELRLYQLVKQ